MGIVYIKLLERIKNTMGKILKRGRVVILLAGRRAGKKAVIIKQVDEGKKKRKFGHALVVGIERTARKITSGMSKKKITKRASIKPFVKYVNNTHLLATRFIVKDDKDFDFRSQITESSSRTHRPARRCSRASRPRCSRDTSTQRVLERDSQLPISSSLSSDSEKVDTTQTTKSVYLSLI